MSLLFKTSDIDDVVKTDVCDDLNEVCGEFIETVETEVKNLINYMLSPKIWENDLNALGVFKDRLGFESEDIGEQYNTTFIESMLEAFDLEDFKDKTNSLGWELEGLHGLNDSTIVVEPQNLSDTMLSEQFFELMKKGDKTRLQKMLDNY